MILLNLWTKRFLRLVNELGKYGRLIFNDHFSILLFVMVGFFLFFYRQQLDLLGQNHNIWLERGMMTSIGLGLVGLGFMGRPIWLMKEPDQAYLFVRGQEWLAYWLRGFLLGLGLPLLINLIWLGISYPILNLIGGGDISLLLLVLHQVLYLVLMNGVYLMRLYGFSLSIRWGLALVHAINLTLLFVWTDLSLFGMAFSIIFTLFLIGQVAWIYHKRLQWADFEFALATDLNRQAKYYRLLSFFVDVPQTKAQVQRRPYWDILIEYGSSKMRGVAGYLYLRILFRNKAYSGIWLRILVFIGILLSLESPLYLKLGLGLIGFYLTLVQLVPMSQHYDYHPVLNLYPDWKEGQLRDLQYAIGTILLIQCLVFIGIVGLVGVSLLEVGLIVFVWVVSLIALIFVYIPFWVRRTGR